MTWFERILLTLFYLIGCINGRFIRFLNQIGLRKDVLYCMRQKDTWCWPDYLGKKTEGHCERCKEPIFFERQNWPYRKICQRCMEEYNDQ